MDLVHRFMRKLDFRRFNTELSEPIAIDDTDSIEKLTEYGEELDQKLLRNEVEPREDPPETVVLR